MFLNLAAFLEHSSVNGPGRRAAVWVQGCPFRCRGCFNPDMQPFIKKQVFSVEKLAKRILAVKDIRGVTFSGGEPFSQSEPLAKLGWILKENGLDIVTYTGHILEDLERGEKPGWRDLLEVTDLLIDGPFIREKRANPPFRGSSNQRLIHLTDRLKNHRDLSRDSSHATEIVIDPEGNIKLTGFPQSPFILPCG